MTAADALVRGMIWTLPNLLTTFRILAGMALPLVVLVLPHPLADWVAVTLFLAAAVTDFLDGFLARKLNQVSDLGAVLDPVADKIIVISGLVLLISQTGPVAWLLIPAAVIIGREFLVAGLRAHLGQQAGGLSVTWVAKAKTAAQMAALGMLLAAIACEASHLAAYARLSPPAYQAALDARGTIWWMAEAGYWLGLSGGGVLALATILTLVSGMDYLQKALRAMKEGTQ